MASGVRALIVGGGLMRPVPGVAGRFIATGFSGHGLALAPAVGDVLARLGLGYDPLPSLWAGLAWRAPRREALHSPAHAATTI